MAEHSASERHNKKTEITDYNQALLDAMPCIAMVLRRGSREIVALNKAAALAGAKIGKTCYSSWPEYRQPCSFCRAPNLWEMDEKQQIEVDVLDRTWEAYWTPLSEDYYLHYAFDITEHKIQQETLLDEQREKSIILNNLAERVTYLNPKMEIIWTNDNPTDPDHSGSSQYRGKKCYTAYYNLPEPCPECPIMEAFHSATRVSGIHQSPDGTYWRVTGTPLFDGQGKFCGVLDTALDITDLKRTEQELINLNQELDQRVKLRTAELEEINRELNAFTYSVSHDLRSPVRRINGFSRALFEEWGDQLDQKGLDYLSRVINSTNRLEDLIDDLLKLSRVGRQDIEIEPVELSVLVSVYLKVLQEKEPSRQVEAIVEPAVVVKGDTALLRIALENLLDNAWKFTVHQPKAVIEFGCRQEAGQAVFFIRDNGVGFDMKYSRKLFNAFQRLHSEKDFPGTGIGLSIVARIVRRHGGDIRAEASTGKGATFYFTLSQ